MKYYLIDFENVGTDDIKDFNSVSEGDTLILFYSEHCKAISLDVINTIIQMKLHYSSFKVKVGTKNALDFQLATYLGYLIGQGNREEDKYFIISKDKGYDCLCEYWKDYGFEVERVLLTEEPPEETAKKTATKKAAKPKKRANKIQSSDILTIDEITKVLTMEDAPTEVLEIFNHYKTKVAINNGLAKKFKDSKKASAIYKKLKPLLKEKNKS